MFDNGKAKKAIAELKPELAALDQKLTDIEKIKDPVDRLVALFNAIAPWSDKEQDQQGPVAKAAEVAAKASRLTEEFAALQSLQACFMSAGRAEFGWNRTKPGETVTGDNVFLGNTHGRWTFTANKWKENYNKAHPSAAEDKAIIEGQAAGFADPRIRAMRQAIGKLTTAP